MSGLHFVLRAVSLSVAVVAGSFSLVAKFVSAADTAGPATSNRDNAYVIEVVGDRGSWDPETGTWTQTKRTKGGVDPEGHPYCQWEWTKTWHIEESNHALWYGDTGWPVYTKNRGGSRTLWAFGALFGGSAWAWDFSAGSAEELGAVVGSGTVEVRLISAPECDHCTQTITATARPSFKAETSRYNDPATGEAFGYAQVHGLVLTNLSAEAKGGVVTEAGAPQQHTYGLGPAGVTVTITSTNGPDLQAFVHSDADTKDVSAETIFFASAAHLKAYADGWWPNEGEITAALHSGTMATEIKAECKGCCKGWVNITVTTSVD